MDNIEQLIETLEEMLFNLKNQKETQNNNKTEHQELSIILNEIREDVDKIKEAII